MFTFFSRALIRVAMIAAVAGAGLIIADGASAKIIILSGSSRGEIMGACAAAGGTYNDNGGTGTSAEYGCKTDKGEIQCSEGGNCAGFCQKCSALLPKKGGVKGVVGGAGTAGNA
jgi:hypothetical protein